MYRTSLESHKSETVMLLLVELDPDEFSHVVLVDISEDVARKPRSQRHVDPFGQRSTT